MNRGLLRGIGGGRQVQSWFPELWQGTTQVQVDPTQGWADFTIDGPWCNADFHVVAGSTGAVATTELSLPLPARSGFQVVGIYLATLGGVSSGNAFVATTKGIAYDRTAFYQDGTAHTTQAIAAQYISGQLRYMYAT